MPFPPCDGFRLAGPARGVDARVAPHGSAPGKSPCCGQSCASGRRRLLSMVTRPVGGGAHTGRHGCAGQEIILVAVVCTLQRLLWRTGRWPVERRIRTAANRHASHPTQSLGTPEIRIRAPTPAGRRGAVVFPPVIGAVPWRGRLRQEGWLPNLAWRNPTRRWLELVGAGKQMRAAGQHTPAPNPLGASWRGPTLSTKTEVANYM
jgi:hypothetical protein